MKIFVFGFILALFAPGSASAEATFDPSAHTFRLDGGDVTYVFGINELDQVQTLYWGKRLPDAQRLERPHSISPYSHDLSVTTKPQEFTRWGGGLFVEPDVKITFTDGNRDLALKYVSHNGNRMTS